MSLAQYLNSVNEGASLRQTLAQFVTNISLSTPDSILSQCQTLLALSAQPNEITRDTAVLYILNCIISIQVNLLTNHTEHNNESGNSNGARAGEHGK